MIRPEKNHKLQVLSFAHLLNKHPEHKGKAKLIMIGSCRNDEDQKRIDELQKLIEEKNLQVFSFFFFFSINN